MRRIPELDALRGLAALAIVVYHLWLPDWGFVATSVDLFFVMSGFLITAIILRQLDRPGFLATFYARRALRIWPIYYLSLIAFVALNAVLPDPEPLDGLPWYLTYTQRLPLYWSSAEPPFSACFGHTWTLAIEEQFYIVWPLLIFALGRKSLLPAGLGMVALATVMRMLGFPTWLLLTRCDGLAMGGLLALIFDGRESPAPRSSRRLSWTFALVGVGAFLYLAPGSALSRWLGAGGMADVRLPWAASLRYLAINVMYFGLVGWVVTCAGRPWLAPLRDRRLCALGLMSYGIYLYHYIVFELLQRYGPRLGLADSLAFDALKLALTFGLAVLSWKFIEAPLLARKDRFNYGRISMRPAAAPPAPRPVGVGGP